MISLILVISPQDGVWRASSVITPSRCDAKQMLGDDQAEQLDAVESGLTPGRMIAWEGWRGQDLVVEIDVKCGQQGVEIGFHTQGLTPFVNDERHPPGQISQRTHSSRCRRSAGRAR